MYLHNIYHRGLQSCPLCAPRRISRKIIRWGERGPCSPKIKKKRKKRKTINRSRVARRVGRFVVYVIYCTGAVAALKQSYKSMITLLFYTWRVLCEFHLPDVRRTRVARDCQRLRERKENGGNGYDARV